MALNVSLSKLPWYGQIGAFVVLSAAGAGAFWNFYARDAQTEGLLIIGEIGGHEEEDFAAGLAAHGFSKPVFALIAGSSAPEGVTKGHAGALVHGSHGSYAAKRAALEAAGARVHATLDAMVSDVCDVLKRR